MGRKQQSRERRPGVVAGAGVLHEALRSVGRIRGSGAPLLQARAHLSQRRIETTSRLGILRQRADELEQRVIDAGHGGGV